VRRIFEGIFGEWRAWWMLAAVAAVVIGLAGERIEIASVQAQTVSPSLGAGGLIAHFVDAKDRVILIDPLLRRIAVYHIEGDGGAIQLKSVRNLNADLQVQEYNSGDPSPIDMQKLLDRNQ